METGLGGIGEFLRDGLAAGLALLLGIAVLRLGSAAFALLAPRDAEAVPLLHVIALGTGLALGVALVVSAEGTTAFLPSRIFTEDGPWAVSLSEFLNRHALPRGATLPALRDAMGALEGVGALAGWLALVGLLAGGAAALKLWRGQAQLRAFAAFLMLSGCTALLLHYGLHLLAWVAAQFSFWLFALLLLAFQHWRYGRRTAH